MTKKQAYKIIFILLLILTGCKPIAVYYSGFSHNVYGQPIIQCKVPISINLKKADLRTAKSIKQAMTAWNNSLGRALFHLSDTSPNLIINVTEWKLSQSQQAVTRTNWGGNCIGSSTIFINNDGFKYYSFGETKVGINLDALMIHELGHVLGLMDNDNPASVMYRYLAEHEDRTNITQTDINNLKAIYK